MTLPVGVVDKDHALEQKTTKASEELARHRWHWTLNKANPERVSIRAYARAVGRNDKTIGAQVNGYVEWLGACGTARSLNDSIERAKMGVEKAELVEAVAEANKVGFQQARKTYSNDVTRVRDAVEAKAEKQPDMTAEERSDVARKAAEAIARSRKARQRQEETHQPRVATLVFIDGKVSHAKRDLDEALKEARRGDLDEDAVEYLEGAIGHVQSLANLLRLAVVGSLDVDWDAEMANLKEA